MIQMIAMISMIEKENRRMTYSAERGGIVGKRICVRSKLCPTGDELTIKYNIELDEKAQIEITSITGSVIVRYELNTGNQELKINTAKWNGGIYLCRLSKNNRESEVKKLVIIK